MKKILLTIALVLLSGATMAKEDADGRLTADELNAKNEKTAIVIRTTSKAERNTYYNQAGQRAALSENSVVYWVPAGEGAFYITKGNGENDYLQKTNLSTFGTKDNAAKFHAIQPTETGEGVYYAKDGNIYSTWDEGGEYWVRFELIGNDKWFNFNGMQYNTGTGVWTVQNVYEPAFVTYNFTFNGETKLTKTVPGIVGEDFPELPELPFGCTATKPEGKVLAGNTTQNIKVAVSLPFVAADSYKTISDWYYLSIGQAGYLLYHEDGKTHIELNKTEVDKSNKNAYLWAFVGNPFDGYKLMNRAKGDGFILSSTTNTFDGKTGANTHPIMTSVDELQSKNTYWIPTASTNLGDGGFYLAQKDANSGKNKMNNRDGKLAYWNSGADAGSTFKVLHAETAYTFSQVTASELMQKTKPACIAIKNLSYTNNRWYVGNTGAAPYSAEELTNDAIFVWEPVNEGQTGSYYLRKLDGTYMQTSSPKDFGTIDNAAKFTATNPTSQGSGSTNFNGDGDSNLYITGSTDANLVRFVKGNNWINVQNGANGDPAYNTGTGGWTIHYVYEATMVEAYDVKITDAKYATFYAVSEVAAPEDVDVYYVTSEGIESGKITLTEIENRIIPANTAVIIYSETAGEYKFEASRTNAAAISNNLLKGTAINTNIIGQAYVLGVVDGETGLYKTQMRTVNLSSTSGSVSVFLNNANKAYLPANAVPAAAQGAANFSFRFEGEGTTGIEQITDNREQSTVIYDLTGRRVEEITAPGIYIVGGKKVLVK